MVLLAPRALVGFFFVALSVVLRLGVWSITQTEDQGAGNGRERTKRRRDGGGCGSL